MKPLLDKAEVNNKYYDKEQFTKLLDEDVAWIGLFKDQQPLALAALLIDNPKGFTFINELQAFISGYGKPLIEYIINHYANVYLLSSPGAENTLLDYYRELNLKELTIESSIFNTPLHFFLSIDINKNDLSSLYDYLLDYYNN